MIQFNLLPDVKLDYLRAVRQRRLVFSVSAIIVIVSVALLLSLLSVDGLQKKHLKDLNNDIGHESSTLQNEPQIDKILTVQNQLASLTALHDGKPAAPRLFDYLNEVTPTNITIANFAIDFTQQTMSITGNANSLSDVNQYIDTLKFTNYTTAADSTPTTAFSNVVLSNFGLTTAAASSTTPPASYTITLSYDTKIFDNTATVNLSVPQQVTTRSEVDQPTDLFKATPPTTKASN